MYSDDNTTTPNCVYILFPIQDNEMFPSVVSTSCSHVNDYSNQRFVIWWFGFDLFVVRNQDALWVHIIVYILSVLHSGFFSGNMRYFIVSSLVYTIEALHRHVALIATVTKPTYS